MRYLTKSSGMLFVTDGKAVSRELLPDRTLSYPTRVFKSLVIALSCVSPTVNMFLSSEQSFLSNVLLEVSNFSPLRIRFYFAMTKCLPE